LFIVSSNIFLILSQNLPFSVPVPFRQAKALNDKTLRHTLPFLRQGHFPIRGSHQRHTIRIQSTALTLRQRAKARKGPLNTFPKSATKLRKNERNTKEKLAFIFISECKVNLAKPKLQENEQNTGRTCFYLIEECLNNNAEPTIFNFSSIY
jgi:hypothetical protein